MIEKELIQKVKHYLEKKGEKYYLNSITYKGFRESFKQIDGSERSVYVVSYLVSISDLQYDSDAMFFVHIDAETKKLLYVIGPQSFEKIGS
jgi:hypothetical protein